MEDVLSCTRYVRALCAVALRGFWVALFVVLREGALSVGDVLSCTGCVRALCAVGLRGGRFSSGVLSCTRCVRALCAVVLREGRFS